MVASKHTSELPARRRCSALTKRGDRCGHWAMRASDPPLCNIHAGRAGGAVATDSPQRCRGTTATGERCRRYALRDSEAGLCRRHAVQAGEMTPEEKRCTGTTERGARCGQAALAGSDPPLCAYHSESRPAGRRCGARRADGERCGKWAMRGSDPPLCNVHAGRVTAAASVPERQCVARKEDGTRCENWAMRGDERQLCSFHNGQMRAAVAAGSGYCSAQTKQGTPCPLPAMRGSDPPLCATHAGVGGFEEGHLLSWKHGYYSKRLFPWDLAYMEETKRQLAAGEFSLDLELALCRFMLWRLAGSMDRYWEMPLEELLRTARLIFRGTRAVSMIVRIARALEEGEREREALEAWAEGVLALLEEE